MKSQHMLVPESPGQVDVLVIGGGPCGLSASIALSRQGISSLLVERHEGTAPHPKALHLSTRTMEVFRAWGIADDIRSLALPLSDHGLFLGRSLSDPAYTRHAIWPMEPPLSPERSHLVSQEILEPALRTAAERGNGTVLFGTRLLSLAPTPVGSTPKSSGWSTGPGGRYASGTWSRPTAVRAACAPGSASSSPGAWCTTR